jgi:hypothetical protein
VGQNGRVLRLVAGLGRRSRYATLSHCWGQASTIKTETHNLALRETSISLQALPKTFREAVLVCRKLNIPFLWIDSLCIVQDDKRDWEFHASGRYFSSVLEAVADLVLPPSVMGSIFYNSTLTLAASDASNSSKGLFIPAAPDMQNPELGTIALLPSFGDNRGRVYASGPTWYRDGAPFYDIKRSVLQSRGWVMQERYLSPRTIHFLVGRMLWECLERGYDQNGYRHYRDSLTDPLRKQLKTFQRMFESSYRFAVEDDKVNEALSSSDDDVSQYSDLGIVDADQSSEDGNGFEDDGMFALNLYRPYRGRAAYVVDLRAPLPHDNNPPIPIYRNTDRALHEMLDIATRQTIYYMWYEAVTTYSDRQLTFASDKLPALAGIASRVHTITKDKYLAGHWRRELERSLFWRRYMMYWVSRPQNGRVKEYRAPSWSWASITGNFYFKFPDISPGTDTPTPIEILESETTVDGNNPFGRVTGGKIVMMASIIRGSWVESGEGWLLKGNSTIYEGTDGDGLQFVDAEGSIIGAWHYDDAINGIMPGPLLTQDTILDDVRTRSISFRSYRANRQQIFGPEDYPEECDVTRTLWARGTYVPQELVLVKGSTIQEGGYNLETYKGKHVTSVEVLVLGRTEGPEGEYRRVGVGKLAHWDDAVDSREVLTVV